MSAEAITIVSGFVLLGVFVLVGWKPRRKHARDLANRRKETKP